MRIIPSFGWKRCSCHVAFGILITCLFYVNVFYLYHSAERDAEEFTANFKWIKRPLLVTERCNLSGETEKALKRAQSDTCKQQIISAYCSHLEGSLYPAALHRSCPYEGMQKFQSLWRLRNLGCYADSRKKRLLNSAGIRYGNFNSISACVDYCFQLGCSVAGVEFGEECFCGKVANLKLGQKLEPGLCDTYPCPANSSVACGGFNAVAAYHTGYKDPPKIKLKTNELLLNKKPAKIAFLLQLNGRAVRQVVRLLRLIYRPEHIYLVHVDSRQNYMYREMRSLQKSISAAANFHVLTRRFATIWGGASLLTMFLSSADQLLQLSSDWEYLVNLSESDMPLRPVDELSSLLGNCNGTSFLRSHGDTTVAFIRRQGLGKLFVECDYHMWRLGERKLPKGVRVDGGSDWLILHRSLVEYAVQEHDQLVVGLRQFFQNALLPLETFFHTLAQNSRFCDRIVNSNLKLTNWRRKRGCNCQHLQVVDWCGCSPNVFRMADWDRLQKVTRGSNGLHFFARKFDPLIDLRIIVQLERTVANGSSQRQSTDLASSLPYWQNEFHHVDDQLHSLDPRRRVFLNYAAHVGRRYLLQPTSCNVGSVDCPVERVLQFNLFKQSNAEMMDLLVSIGGTCRSEPALHDASFQWSAEVRLQQQRKITFNSGKWSKNRLLDIQLGNEYDVKEEMLRDYVAPIVAKNDRPFLRQRWSVALSDGKDNLSSTVLVVWSTPDGRIDEVQKQQLKANSSGVVVVHLQKQIGLSEDGIWSVRVQKNSDELLAEMPFPVIDPNERLMEKLAPVLDPFFSIKSACLIGKPNSTVMSHSFTMSQCTPDLLQAYYVDCNSTDWSSHSADSISQLLLLPDR
ncbi:Xylosyltransferase oxt [Trichinella pseudospiralis]|uniref:protein xylosyltransferase n=1 Tax=Trichinella pseudospiralis TaxID=6337 RepID=A0A0V1FSY8_TRIPS|nr:Xylosyltransferase oxt [Trichinella pseudospiralis]